MAKRTLKEYRAKRDFKVTPEPAPDEGSTPAPGARPTFMVHKHDATRLHYDLRLEMDGALASWAVPKGPSYEIAQKRLAVQTEDHPLEYGSFEGRIPDGEYGAGDSIIWDRGTYDTVPPGQASAQRKKGHLVISLEGEKLSGVWHLVRTRPQGGKAQWLLFKSKDGKEQSGYDVVAERPESVVSGRRVTRGPVTKKALAAAHPEPQALLEKVWPPMLATLSKSTQGVTAHSHVLELKYDGYRGLAALSRGKVAFQSRNALDLTSRFPSVARALSRLVIPEAVLDGELVALDAHGVSRFQQLMTEGAQERYVVFDLLWLDGQDLRSRPLEERRELLESVLANVPPPLQLAARVDADPDDALAHLRKLGGEGLIAKRRHSPYSPGRGMDWLKLKVTAGQEVAILGYTPLKNGVRGLGALLVGVQGKDGLEYAGKVGTGFSAKDRKELLQQLEPDALPKAAAKDAPRMKVARWVKPRLVAQVAFTEWTKDGKLRHPSFQGLRLDKTPDECVRERPAEERGAHAAPRRAAARASRAPAAEPVQSPVTLTSEKRVVFPESGITKGEVFRYYQDVAEVMVKALDGRPLALQQWPKGIGAPGFFRQQVHQPPDWATTVSIQHQPRKLTHLIVDRPQTLEWLANQNALTLHMWSSRVPHLTQPDWVVFDLDPGDGQWEDLIQLANALRGLLEELSLESVPKTSGKRGLHVLVPVAAGHTYQDTLDFAVAITQTLANGLPKLATVERKINLRHGRLYLDAMQNAQGKTLVAPYTLRALEGAPVSAPLRWSEVTNTLDPKAFTLKTMRARLDAVGDLFAPALNGKQRLPRLRP